MSKDELKQPSHDGDDVAALEATEELSDDALENVSGGYMNVKNTTPPWPDQG
jgi:bacteriocin-like protein